MLRMTGNGACMAITRVVERTHTAAMEQLQDGYVAAVAASAGTLAEFITRDYHGYDVELIRQPDPLVEQAAVRLQLKSTTLVRPKPGVTSFNYRFKERKHFDSLAMPRTTLHHILVVMVVGPDQHGWTVADHDALAVRHSCYWVNLAGQTAPPTPLQPVVSVPTANLFDVDALSGILDRIEQGGQP